MNQTSKSNQATDALLQVSNLSVKYGSGKSGFVAVSDIALEIAPGETLGVVGESGSGKSTIGKAILGLEKAHSGSIRFLGRDITNHSLKQRKKSAEDLRVVFQDPYSSLNPDMTIGATLVEPLGLLGVSKDESMRRAREGDRVARFEDARGLQREGWREDARPAPRGGGRVQSDEVSGVVILCEPATTRSPDALHCRGIGSADLLPELQDNAIALPFRTGLKLRTGHDTVRHRMRATCVRTLKPNPH